MSENELVEHRLLALETDVKTLYGKTNSFAINQAQTNTKLDNMILTLGELKESIAGIKERPSMLLDKFIFAIIGAIGTGIGAVVIMMIKGG